MQAAGLPRPMQRRSPGAEPGPPPNVPVRSISPGVGLQPRSSSAAPGPAPAVPPMARSGQSGSTKRPSQTSGNSSSIPLSQIEKSVTHLLVATKQLLETLTQWSRGQASDGQVSDVYVRLGYEFNMACRAFSAINVDTSDLGNVPELLRHILEATLSQEASVESLENYLPRIRDIIINLLHGLKRKQQKLRQKQARDRESGTSNTPSDRTTSTSTLASTGSGLTNMLEEGIESGYQPRSDSMSSAKGRLQSQRDQSRGSVATDSSSMSSSTMQNIPVVPPYPESSSIPGQLGAEINIDSFPPPPPPPPPKQNQSALAALQKGGELERRASRRYSQYQINKHLGGPANAMPILPPQNTPIPNRGGRGEIKESMRAVNIREQPRHNRNMSSISRQGGPSSSPSRMPDNRTAIDTAGFPEPPAAGGPAVPESPEDRYKPSATLDGPPVDDFPIVAVDSPADEKPPIELPAREPVERPETATDGREVFSREVSPQSPSKDLTLFLQYKSKVKKIVLPEGRSELSLGRLQLAFIEKFSWNTHQNGVDLPEIYIQDPVSGIRHELEDLSDIQDRTVLVLNIESLDEVKRHIDDGLGAIKKMVQEVKQNVDDQGVALQRVSDRQLEAAKEMTRLVASPPVLTPPADGARPGMFSPDSRKISSSHLAELQSLRRDLAVVRQTFSSFQSDIQTSMSTIRTKAGSVKAAAVTASIPDLDGDVGYSYVNKGRKEMNTDSDRLVARVDDLQDLVEDLRKDVVHRGVRPLPRQLEAVTKDITMLSMELKKMDDFLKHEKPIWTKIWEKELEDVCQGRDELRLMEDLMVDLRDDLEKASETFSLVEQATKEQMKDNGTGASAGTARNFSRSLNTLGSNGTDPSTAKEGVLGEVRALQPNHEDRLEAIERAEKMRQIELQNRSGNPLQKELSSFVGEGKLKKSGGFEEVERARKAKDDRIRRQVWERQNGIVPMEDSIAEEPIPEDEQANGV